MRIIVLVSALVLLGGATLVAADSRTASATNHNLIDYDLDDDSLIDVDSWQKWGAIHYDMAGNGIAETRNGPTSGRNTAYATAYPTPAATMGCGARDHDNDPATPEQAQCIGYELIKDIDLSGNGLVIGMAGNQSTWPVDYYDGKIVGNGLRIMNNRVWETGHTVRNISNLGLFNGIGPTGSVEGLGHLNPQHESAGGTSGSINGGITGRVEGTVVGSYVLNGHIGSHGRNGGIAGSVGTDRNWGHGTVAHSYVLGPRIGHWSQFRPHEGGLIGRTGTPQNSGADRAVCLNSYFSGTVNASSNGGLIIGDNQQNGGRIIGCVADGTTDGDGTGGGIRSSKAAMSSTLDYSGPFATWDDYPMDGSYTPIADGEPKLDVWYFGDESMMPSLKGWGHDRTNQPDRPLIGESTAIDLCTRTHAVANEIIRLMKDDTVKAAGVSTNAPAEVQALTGCTGSNTQSISNDHIRDYAATSASNMLNLSPDRTFPPSPKLTELKISDFAYLPNVSHIDLSGNAFEELPPRLFDRIPLRFLDLSNNELTSLPADLFAGIASVSTVGGNTLLLNGNSLTHTGIPGRIFDEMTHLNGLDLSDNSLTKVNTRWFEKLNVLGHKPATTPPYTHALGLHLGGNTITEHYYSWKLFTGVTTKVTTYEDVTVNTVTTTAEEGLRAAIVAAITAANTSVTNLSLGATDTSFYFNSGGSTTGYQATTVTSCVAAQTVGPGRGDYLGGTVPACQEQPHWTPPHPSGDTAATMPAISEVTPRTNTGSVQVTFTHAVSTAWVGYELRWRPSAADPWTPWLIVPVVDSAGSKTVTLNTPNYGLAHSIEMRVRTTTGPPSAAVTASITTTSANWVTGFASTTSPVSIAMSWNAISASITSGHSVVGWYYRYKESTETLYGDWLSVSGGSSARAHTITGLTASRTYNLQLVAAIDDMDADSDADYYTNRAERTATTRAPTALNPTAAGHTEPGSIRVQWALQTAAQNAQTRLQVRRKKRTTDTWDGITWTEVPDSDTDGDYHDETNYTFEGLDGGVLYDVQVRLWWDDANGGELPQPTSATATRAAAPVNFQAQEGADPGEIDLSWNRQTVTTNSVAHYEVRYKKSSDSWPTAGALGWADISGSDHTTRTHTLSNLEALATYNVELRFNVHGPSPEVSANRSPRNVPRPTGLSVSNSPGEIVLTWTPQTAITHAQAGYEARWKKTTESWPTGAGLGWTNLAGVGHGASRAGLTGLEIGARYHVQMRFRASNTIGVSPATSTRISGAFTGVSAPTGVTAATGTLIKQVAINWNAQTQSTSPLAKFQVRGRLSPSGTWSGWSDVPDSTSDADTHAYNETGGTWTAGLRFRQYDVQVRLAVGTTYSTAVQVDAVRAGYIPRNLQAVPGTVPGTIKVTWDAQTAYTANHNRVALQAIPTGTLSMTAGWPCCLDPGQGSHATTSLTLSGSLGTTTFTAGSFYDVRANFSWNGIHDWVDWNNPNNEMPSVLNVMAATVLAPANLQAATSTKGVHSVDLTWDQQTASTDSNSHFEYRYRTSANPSASPPVAAGAWGSWNNVLDSGDTNTHTYDETGVTVTGLTSTGSYDFEVRFHWNATHGDTPSANIPRESGTRSGVPNPLNFMAETGTAPGSIDLSWDIVTDADSYDYRCREAGTSNAWTWTDVTDQDSDSAVDDEDSVTATGLSGGTVYTCQVRAQDGSPVVDGSPSSADATAQTMTPPTNIMFNQGTNAGEIALSWGIPTGGTVSGFQYRVKLTTDSWPAASPNGWTNVPDQNSNSNRADETSYTITSLRPGLQYNVEMRTQSTVEGDSLVGDDERATVTAKELAAPTTFVANIGLNGSDLRLSWNAQSGMPMNDTVVQYEYRIKKSADANWGNWTPVPDQADPPAAPPGGRGDETSYTITGLESYVQYDVDLRAALNDNDEGTATTVEYYSETASQASKYSGINAVTGLSVAGGTDPGSVDLSWNAQQDFPMGTAVTYSYRYKVAGNMDPSPWNFSNISGTDFDRTTHKLTGLTNNVRYEFQLKYNAGSGLDSGTATEEGTTTAVAAITNFSATAPSSGVGGRIVLSWDEQTAVTDAAAEFQYRYKEDGTNDPSPWNWTSILDSTGSGGDPLTHKYDETGITISTLDASKTYHIELRFYVSAAVGASPTVTETQTPSQVPVPTGFSASAGTPSGSIDLSWTASAGATGYQYRCNPAGTSCSMTSPTSAGTGTSHTINGLTTGETYSIQIRAQTTNVGDSAWTSVQTADPQPEAAPTSFMASTGSNPGTISLSWTAPTSMALGGTLQGFEYQYRRASLPDVPANWSGWADVPDNPDQTADPDTDRDDETAYTITSLWAGVSYVVQIRTESSIGYSNVGMSTTSTATSGAVAAPASFSAAVGDMPGEIDLTWTHITTGLPDSNADAVVNYQFRTKLTSGSTWTDWTNMPTANTASFTVTGLTAGTQHDIELRAAIADNDEGTATTAEYHSSSDDETGIYAGIAIPDGLSATTPSSGNPGRLTVSWTAQTTFGATFTSAKYEYRYKETATANWPGTSPFGWQDVPSSDRSTDMFTISGIKGGTAFDVQVRFVPNSTIGAGAAASDDGTSRAVTAPTFTAATSTAAAGAIELSWTAQGDTTGSEAKYQVRRKLASGTWPTTGDLGWSDVADTGGDGAHNESSLRLTGLSAGQSYHVQLRFHWSNAIGPSLGTQRTATASAIPTPVNFGASAGTSPGSVSLSWDAVASATYQYRCSPAGTRCDTTAKPAGSGTSFTVTGLEGGETYSFQVRALVSGVTGSSPWSPVQTAQPQQEAPPRNFDADSGDNPGEIDIEWDAPNSPGGTVIGFDYRYRRANQPDVPASWTDWTDVPDSDSTPAVNPRSNEDEYTITSLWAGVSYVVQVRTESSIGASLAGMSTTDTATSGAVAAPASFSGSIGANPGTINLSWTHITTGLPGSDTVVNYQFRTKLTSGSTWGNWTNMPTANTSSFTIPATHNLTAGTQYDVDLRAAIADSDEGTASTAEYESAAASVTSIYSGIASPSPLRAITPTSGNPGRITISWTAQTTFSTGTYQYRYRTSPNAYPGTWTNVPSSSSTTNTFTISDLTNGRSYDVQVRFVAGTAGTSAPSTATGNTRAIAIPTGLTAAPAAATVAAIDLSWDPQSAVTVGTAKFQYRFKRDNVAWGSQTWNDIGDSAADSDSDAHNERAFTITSGLTAGARYDIQLRLFMSTAIGASQPREVTANASTVPIPQGFSASTGGGAGEILISWSAVNGATGYEYRCSPANTGCDTTWKSAGTGTQFRIQNLANGEWYSLQLRATAPNNSASAATGTQRARAQTTPGPETFMLTAGTNPGEIVLAWDPPMDTSAPVTHYEYRYKLSRDADSAYPATYTRSPDSDSDGQYDDERTATLTGLTSGASYDVQIRVFASSSIGYSLPLIRSRKPTPVPPPTNFREDTMATLNPGEAKLNWNAPVGVSVLRYELRHQLGTTGRWSNWESVGTATTHTFTGLRAGQLRTFQVRTVMTTVGNSDAVSTTGTPTPVPQPTLTATTGTFPGEVNISWTAVTGATSYEYRVRLSTVTGAWTDDAWVSVPATPRKTTITQLLEDSNAIYSVQIRAVIRNVGESDPGPTPAATASPRDEMIMDAMGAETLGSEYKIIEDVPEFLIIEIPPARVSDTFIYRYREANPGLWSRWFKVTPMTRTEPTRHWIRGLTPNTVYEVEIRAYRSPMPGEAAAFTAARSQTRTPVQLDPPEGFEADESSGVILLSWASPARYIPIRYEYSYRKAGETEWSRWIEAPHVGDVGAPQSRWVSDLDRGFRYDFRLRTITVAGPTEPSGTYGTARVNVAEVDRIQPTVRSVNVRAGDQIALTVDVYDSQDGLANGILGREGNRLFICWEQTDPEDVEEPGDEADACVPGGSMFGTPNNGRRVTYTVPDTPGVYTVRAEPQPDGICTSHHEGADEITQAERDACTATFTIRVSAAPTVTAPRPDPQDPRSIPTSLTDDEGQSYAVFTPAAGGTYTNEQITVTAPAGAIPDRTVLGIASTVSEITPPAPIPGTTLTVAGQYHEVTAITGDAEPPVPSITLSSPITACLPFPNEFRADLSNVVVVQRKADGNLTLLSSKVRLTNGEFNVCGTLSTLPATLGVARVGTVPQPAPDREADGGPDIEMPDTGAWSPSIAALAAMLLILGALAILAARLSGMHRIRRMRGRVLEERNPILSYPVYP